MELNYNVGGKSMLTPELQKLKDFLEGSRKSIDEQALLRELHELDRTEMKALDESLSMSTSVCPTCGRAL